MHNGGNNAGMTRRNQLTDVAVKSRNKAPGYYLDGHGLYLQVSASGSRSWVLRYTLQGRVREMGLGSTDDFPLALARERAQRARQLLADGIDPIDHRNAARATRDAEAKAAVAQATTFEQCALEFHTANRDEWRNAKHAAQWINTLRVYAFPKFGHVSIDSVSKTEILSAISPIWKTKAETAGRVLQRVRTVLNYGAAKDYCRGRDAEFWEQVRLALGTNERAKKVEHHSACPYSEVAQLLEYVIGGPSTEVVKLAFEFTVLTAARSGETRGATWTEIDWETASWVIPDDRMKAGKVHRVPLSQHVLAMLKSLKVRREDDGATSALIFPNNKGQQLSDMVFTQLLRRMGVPYTMHGFRATFRTWATERTEFPHEMVEMALAHAVGDETVRAYMRTTMVERRRELMEHWAAHVLIREAQQPPDSNVELVKNPETGTI